MGGDFIHPFHGEWNPELLFAGFIQNQTEVSPP
jgi:hypothetical protein